jgi:hypothetical protein
MNNAPRTSSSGLVIFAILHHVALAVSTIFTIASLVDSYDAITWTVLSIVFAIPAAVFSSLILHRAWSAVQDGVTTVSPGKAVGFCFIPFFNLYWNFVAHVGLMKEVNRLAEARGRPDQKVNEGIALTFSILTASICLAIFAAPFAVVFIWQAIGAVKDLENA